MVHEKALLAMKTHLAKTLSACIIKDGFPVYETYEEDVGKFADETLKNKELGRWLSYSNVFLIFFRKVQQAVSEITGIDNKAAGLLKDILGDTGTESLIQEILNFIMSMPRSYSVYFRLIGLEFRDSKISLAEDISLVRFVNDNDIPRGAQTPKSQPSLWSFLSMSLLGNYIETNTTYACIKGKGYAGDFDSDSAFVDAMTKFKQLLHLGLIYGGFKLHDESHIGLFPNLGNRISSVIAIEDADESDMAGAPKLSTEIAQYAERLVLNTPGKIIAVAIKTFCPEPALQDLLKVPIWFIGIADKNNNAKTIRTAIEWAFDSAINKNETIAFLQACIGIEALLGEDSGQELVTDRLADRCAYLLGTYAEKRKKIRKNFRELYRIRSKLVHGRIVRLEGDERRYLEWGQLILGRMITKEIANLKSEK